MPSRLGTGTSTAMNPSRFELPALDLNFGRITDGTNIPPPPSSFQKVPTPPQTPPADKEAVDAANGADDEVASTPPNDARVSSIGGASVVSGGRPDSRCTSNVVDEKWSKRSSGWFKRLRGADPKRSSFYYEENSPVAPSPKKFYEPPKKSYEAPQRPSEPPQKPAGPPPPMISEIADLESDEGSLGSDLFKNIK